MQWHRPRRQLPAVFFLAQYAYHERCASVPSTALIRAGHRTFGHFLDP